MGRPRKSLEQHLRDGTYRADRHGPLPAAKTKGPSKPPVKPANIDGTAEKLWDEMLLLLGAVVTDRDGPMLRELCNWWAELKRIQVALKEANPGDKGYNQLLIAAGICTDKFDKIAARFGLTPADRAKLKSEAPSVPVAQVPVRGRTALDRKGPPT